MTLTFWDPRDLSTKRFSTIQINNFIQELQDILTSKPNLKPGVIDKLIESIKSKNEQNSAIQTINIDIQQAPELINLAESYQIPISVSLNNIAELSMNELTMNELFANKKCLKALVLTDYQNITDQFVDILLTTDIYDLSLYFITPSTDKFYKLIAANKLIKFKLSGKKEDLNYSSLFNNLLNSLDDKSRLQHIIVNDINICGPDDESNATYLASMIQRNINLKEINIEYCKLTTNFLGLLADKLLLTEKNSIRPLKFNLGYNTNVNLVIDKFAGCLAQNININNLKLHHTGLNVAGGELLGQALKHNNILNKLSLISCPLGHSLQTICRSIIKNPQSQIINLNLGFIEQIDLAEARSLANLITANRLKSLLLYKSFKPRLTKTEKINIYKVLLDALAKNTSIRYVDINLSDILRNKEIRTKLKYVFLTRTVPIYFVRLRNKNLKDFMQLQMNNYAISSKTLIQILKEYKKIN